ncbi:TRAP transporter large permease subunit [Leisingera daeponensis]|uniref:TRAP transporter large permease subunit n=1 Tax=Leisingera daeponensis TaxID=405746 RepID=A0ABS7NJ92_9RHOB|nr:TRAP transporter large permease subunit [Leisingera daeponensis]MBY6141255.1 TRAP transporter large permease subunit [Leisingera daeponensis]
MISERQFRHTTDRAEAGVRSLTGFVSGAASIWIFCLMLLICGDIFGRTVLNTPLQGVSEIVANSIVAIVFLQAAHALMSGRMTRTDILIGWLEAERPFAASLIRIVFHLAGIFVFAVIATGTWPKLADAWIENEFFGAQGVFTAPVWPIKACLFAGSLLTCLAFAIQVLHDIKTLAGSGRVAPLKILHTPTVQPRGWGYFAAFAVLLVLGYLLFSADLGRVQIGLVAIAFMLLLIFSGAHIAVALIVLSFLGIWLIRDNPNVAMRSLALAADGAINRYLFGVVPLFVLMGLVVDAADIGKDAFRVAAWLLQKIKGGLGMATVAANAVFASITGISIASAAVFSRVAVPQMVANGYNNRFALGVVAGSSVLGMLIPPSLLLIIYGVLAEVSVGALFLAAIVPGALLAAVFGIGIYLMALLRPRLVMQSERPTVIEGETWGSAVTKLTPIAILVLIVLGGIYSGIFTPTEAGAAGAAAAIGVALARRKLTLRRFWNVLVETGLVSVSILMLIIAASMYSRMLTLSTIPQEVTALFTSAGPGLYGFLLVYVAIVIVMGMILDSTSIMLILLPLALPIVPELGGDLVWFGIVTVIAVEIGLLTPPFGLTVYVVKATIADRNTTLGDIFIGTFPFVIMMSIVTLILMFFPSLSLFFR